MTADIEAVRQFCLTLSGVTEQVQWGADLVFKVGGKMFAVVPLEPAPVWISFKTDPETFAELTERPGFRPAAYLARAHWVSLEATRIVPRVELEVLLRRSHELVLRKLSKKAQMALASGVPREPAKRARKPPSPRRRPRHK